MPLSNKSLDLILQSQLSPSEREQGVLYVSLEPVVTDTVLQLPQCSIQVPWNAWLAFIDREPLANWGHSCRYILVHGETGETKSVEARFPPFHADESRHWRVVYKAHLVPPAALAVHDQS